MKSYHLAICICLIAAAAIRFTGKPGMGWFLGAAVLAMALQSETDYQKKKTNTDGK